jgi:outer membrane receptor protein involved in Fe transport
LKAIQSLPKIIILLLIGSFMLRAGNTGKIAGVAKDKQSGEPLIGANILVKGTNLGAATDQDGYFFILQVPPGAYDIEASYIGYHTITVTNIRVNVDLTTRVNIEMESQAIEGPTIIVEAEQSLIQKDITSTRRTTTREEILTTPGLEQTMDVFKLQGGTFLNPGGQSIPGGETGNLEVRDESLQDVHVRGGRGGEILYMVDGVPVTHPIYGGRNVLNLNLVDVEQVELLTGAFNAEYGQAQSGVVNITTRTGSDRFTGGIEYKTDELVGESFNNQYTSFYLGGPEPITQKPER